jgi:hypothetical protein
MNTSASAEFFLHVYCSEKVSLLYERENYPNISVCFMYWCVLVGSNDEDEVCKY